MFQTAQEKKDHLISDIIETRQRLLEWAAKIPPPLRTLAFLGNWSILDILAHLAGWDDTNRQAVKEIRAGHLPVFYDYAERNWASYNARLISEYRMEDLDALIERVRQTQQRLVDDLNRLPAEDFERDFKVRYRAYKVTIGRLLGAELKDEKKHLEEVRNIALLTANAPGPGKRASQ